MKLLFLGNLGTSELIAMPLLFIIIIAVFASVRSRNKNVVFLALSQFRINPGAESQVVIEGRKTGLMEWLLVQLKLGNMYKIHVMRQYIAFVSESAKGEDLILTPIQKVASTACGFKRPIGWLIWAGIMFLFAFFTMGLSIILGLLFILIYYFKKSFYISIQTVGGHSFVLEFKRGLFENIPVNLPYVKQAIEHINRLVLEAQ